MLSWIPWFRDRYLRNYPPLKYVEFSILNDTAILRRGVLQLPVVAKNGTHFPIHVKRIALVVSHHQSGDWMQFDTGDMGLLRSGGGSIRAPALPLPSP